MGFKLQLTATLEGLTDLSPKDTQENPFEYTFLIECTQCREQHDKEITINRFEKHEISGSRGEANFVFKCKNCRKESTISIERTKNVYTIEDSGKSVDFLSIEARGLDIVKFLPENGFFISKGAESITKFDDIDLSEGEFYDYDDNAGAEVSITDISWDIVRS
ncbi:hypothetical protein WICMUC_005419 [Wickerhamomyces mucosus]|uniref:DUF866-domain-containing protein n=1 Tax=Wickerhamomyces mucosus TaxID=1378264 RepID=A0A9P8P873_9ASCO|nr:hypothetical protein WICMUC_005419 [Wickerhamomyces mucosus]